VTDSPQRSSLRAVTHGAGYNRHVPVGDPDLKEIDVEAGDQVRIETYSDRIVIKPDQ